MLRRAVEKDIVSEIPKYLDRVNVGGCGLVKKQNVCQRSADL